MDRKLVALFLSTVCAPLCYAQSTKPVLITDYHATKTLTQNGADPVACPNFMIVSNVHHQCVPPVPNYGFCAIGLQASYCDEFIIGDCINHYSNIHFVRSVAYAEDPASSGVVEREVEVEFTVSRLTELSFLENFFHASASSAAGAGGSAQGSILVTLVNVDTSASLINSSESAASSNGNGNALNYLNINPVELVPGHYVLTFYSIAEVSGIATAIAGGSHQMTTFMHFDYSDEIAACREDFNADGAVDFFDYLDFVDAFTAGGCDADVNNDGVVDFNDYLDFVDAFQSNTCGVCNC